MNAAIIFGLLVALMLTGMPISIALMAASQSA